MDIRQDRNAEFRADAARGFAGRPPCPIPRKDWFGGAVGLVEAGFENVIDPSFRQVFFRDAATCRQSASLSMAHGPPINVNCRVELRDFQMAESFSTRFF
jgi:hypothetical protein